MLEITVLTPTGVSIASVLATQLLFAKRESTKSLRLVAILRLAVLMLLTLTVIALMVAILGDATGAMIQCILLNSALIIITPTKIFS